MVVMKLLDNNHTQLMVSHKELPCCIDFVSAVVELYGGKETNRNKRYVYYIVYFDLLNRRGRG